MSSTLLRCGATVTVAAGAYVAATVVAYKFLTAGVEDQQDTQQQLQQATDGWALICFVDHCYIFTQKVPFLKWAPGQDVICHTIHLMSRD
jgi:hypothetical protein